MSFNLESLVAQGRVRLWRQEGESLHWKHRAIGAGICEYWLIWKRCDEMEDGLLALTLNAVAQIANG